MTKQLNMGDTDICLVQLPAGAVDMHVEETKPLNLPILQYRINGFRQVPISLPIGPWQCRGIANQNIWDGILKAWDGGGKWTDFTRFLGYVKSPVESGLTLCEKHNFDPLETYVLSKNKV